MNYKKYFKVFGIVMLLGLGFIATNIDTRGVGGGGRGGGGHSSGGSRHVGGGHGGGYGHGGHWGHGGRGWGRGGYGWGGYGVGFLGAYPYGYGYGYSPYYDGYCDPLDPADPDCY